MWQFMPATGKSFDLKQNAFRDDRRDVQASTRAALDYLERLYKMFGDWHLALAAYNWGEGNVGKAIARNQRAGLPTTYADLNMPMETRMYVPKLQAMKNIVGNPPSYSVVLPSIPNHPYFQSVPLPRDMDVSVAAKLAEISVEDFKALNPSAHRPVLLAAGIPFILLPWDNAEVFQRNYEASSTGRMATWTAWVVPTTMKVADAAKHAGMNEADFRALNNIPPRMQIKAGSALLIPRTSHMGEDVTARVADNGFLDLSPEAVAKKKAAKGKHGKDTKVASKSDKHKDKTDKKAVASKKPSQDTRLAKK
jgi:membrane-bound lytic murein transglycosylase D